MLETIQDRAIVTMEGE